MVLAGARCTRLVNLASLHLMNPTYLVSAHVSSPSFHSLGARTSVMIMAYRYLILKYVKVQLMGIDTTSHRDRKCSRGSKLMKFVLC